MDGLRFDARLQIVLGAVVALVNVACSAPQVPPGPDPEYQPPEVVPWEGGAAEDPLKNIEDEGEWVDDGPGGTSPSPAPSAEPSSNPEPGPPPNPEPGSAPSAEPTPAPKSPPSPEPSPDSSPSPGPKPPPNP